MEQIKEIIEQLKQRVKFMEDGEEDMDSASWNYQEGIILSGNDAKKIIEYYEKTHSCS